MKKVTAAYLFALFVLFSAHAQADPAVLAESAPKWEVGDSWRYWTEKDLDRTITQGAGMLEISMNLEKVENTMTYTVTGTAEAEGEECYVLKVRGTQKITGNYSTMSFEAESAGGTLVQQAEIEGTDYRRLEDLAFVRAELRSRGTIQLGGGLAGMPTPFEWHAIMIANPPAQLLRFPMVEGEKWRVNTSLSTNSSGSTSGSSITTFNYECEALGLRTVTLQNGESYECIAISQKGSQTTQSQDAGINIDDVDGILFFAPSIGNRVKDEAEGEELVEYTRIGGPGEGRKGGLREAPPQEPLTH